ncbi:MAG TPA: type I restriction-modification enzyme R subunit C-terminal domain-containing protein, partial [Candidatus Binatia bacterium]|nr:type I restriction-modification enzyme R subunit C-terminal domain-containing protein [Candidatus Binatia bacterium]
EDVRRADEEGRGLGLFLRSLVGLSRESAKQVFAEFLAETNLNANQIEFINLIIEHLAEHGLMEAVRLYESPFTDINPRGPEGLFSSSQIDELVALLDGVKRCARPDWHYVSTDHD